MAGVTGMEENAVIISNLYAKLFAYELCVLLHMNAWVRIECYVRLAGVYW